MDNPGILFVIIIPIVLAFMVFGIIQAQKRRDELRKWAEANGLSFSSTKDRGMDDRHREFSCLRHGHSRYAYNIIQGHYNQRPLCLFDYHYVTGSGKNRQTHNFSAVMIDTQLPIKPLFIRTENFFDKVTEFVGMDDIDFEWKEFSDAFYVKSPDKKWAYDVLHQKTMEFLMLAPHFTLDFQGPLVIAYRNKRFSISDFEEAISVIEGILNNLPDYLIQELKGVSQ